MPFKIAVIGCGAIAFSHHGPAYQKYAAENPDTELTACCDLEEDRAQRFREQFGFQYACRDWQRMLDETRPDAVCLNVLPAQTASLTNQILRLGIPILLEKPPGMNRAEVDNMIRCAQETGTPNQVAFNRRYMPLLVHLRGMLAERFAPTEIHHIHYDFCRIGRTDADFSTTAIHGIDAARFIAGSDYTEVRLDYRYLPEFGPHVANIFMYCTFRSGATAQLNFCPVSGLVIERAEVHALGNTFFLHTPIWKGFDYPGLLLHVHNGQVAGQITGPELSGSLEDYVLNGFFQEDAAFFEDIRYGRKPANDIASGKQSVEIAQAVRERREKVVFNNHLVSQCR